MRYHAMAVPVRVMVELGKKKRVVAPRLRLAGMGPERQDPKWPSSRRRSV
jgi:hypothetical protein